MVALVLVVVLAWALLAWACGLAVGGAIGLMSAEDEPYDLWGSDPVSAGRREAYR